MPSLKSIRTRIASVKSTQKITRAIKLVAAARLRRAYYAIVDARPYANALLEAVAEVASRAGAESHPLLEQRPVKKIGLVVLTSDRGLAGGFNTNIFRGVQRFVRAHTEEQRKQRQAAGDGAVAPELAMISLYVVGRKGRDFFHRRESLTVAREFAGAAGDVAEARAQEVALTVLEVFQAAQVDAIYLVFNEFKSANQQRVMIEPLLPPGAGRLAVAAEPPDSQIDFLYEPDKARLLEALLPRYVQSQVHRALLESIASELGARMTAMDSATSNAKDVLARLTLQYNRARQTAITKELLEIVSGAEALKS